MAFSYVKWSVYLGVLTSISVAQAQHAPQRSSSSNGVISTRETVRRSPSELQRAGVSSMYSLSKSQGLGFALGREGVFRNNVNMMSTSDYSSSGQTGADFIDALKKYTREKGCLPNLLIAGHGWGAAEHPMEAIATGSTSRDAGKGIYLHEQKGRDVVSINGDLKRLVDSGEVKFCKSCRIFLHACSISHDYSEGLVKATGCSVVSANYKVSPVDTNTGVYDHVWFTSAGGKFYQYSPRDDGSIARRTIGQEYIFHPASR